MNMVLGVAQTPKIAKTIASVISNNNFTVADSHNKNYPIYSFQLNQDNQTINFSLISVEGHILIPEIEYDQAVPLQIFTKEIKMIPKKKFILSNFIRFFIKKQYALFVFRRH